jgi:hypothetical protein
MKKNTIEVSVMTVTQLRKALRWVKGNKCVYLCIQDVSYIPVERAFDSPSDGVFLIAPDEAAFEEECRPCKKK